MVFEALEREAGRSLTEVVVEAQRRHALTLIKPEEVAPDVPAIRRMLAVRGLGNLVSMQASGRGAVMRIENPCLLPVLIGVLKASFEVASGAEAAAEWETVPGGDLLLQLG